MSSYFDYTIEQPVPEGWRVTAKSTYEDNEVVNPYILKGAFWDTDCYDYNLKDLSAESLLGFTEKVGTYNQKEKDVFKEKGVESYITVPTTSDSGNVKEEVIRNLKLLSNDYRTKSRDTALGVKLSGIAKYWHIFKDSYLRYLDEELNTASESVSIETLTNWILEGKIENLILTGSGCFWVCNHPWEAITYLRDHRCLKDIPDPSELLTGSVAQVIYSKDGKEIPQYRIRKSVRRSTTDDVDDMILEMRKSIEAIKKSNSVENLVKVSIRDLVEEKATEEDKSTNLYKELLKYCGEAEAFGDDEYLEELELQLTELIKLRSLMGTEGRLFWSIE